MTITTAEAAAVLLTTEANVRKLVERGILTPVRPNARPLRFDELAVIELRYERRPRWEKALIRAASDRILAPV